MKKTFFSIALIIVLLVAITLLWISNSRSQKNEIQEFNFSFEKYLNKTIYGADVITIINKATDINEKNLVDKDENGFYNDDNADCIKVEIILLHQTKDNKIEEKKYNMETLEKSGIDRFAESFSLTSFKCTDIEYNKDNKINKIVVKQMEI